MKALETALGRPRSILAYATADFPDRDRFFAALDALEASADAIEIGILFSDPMADGATIQRSSHRALANGSTIGGTLDALARRPPRRPRVLMSYLNPLLSIAYDALAPRIAAASVSGVVIPDLPFDESAPMRDALAAHDIALVPMVTPLTPPARLRSIATSVRGFVYAVTSTGTTGRDLAPSDTMRDYLACVRATARVPVIAGFGIRSRDHVGALCPPADGVVVGSALVDAVESGADLAGLIASLR